MSVPTKSEDMPRSRMAGAVYEPAWERISDALVRVMQNGVPKNIAQEAICQAIADGAIKFRSQLKRHASKHMTSSTVLQDSSFEIPATIKPCDMDWETSRPVKPWIVARGAHRLPGYWYLEWLELRKTDVTDVLCSRQVCDETSQQNPDAEPAKTTNGQIDSIPSDPGFGGGLGAAGTAPAARPRGPRPAKWNATKAAMLKDTRGGKLTEFELRDMREKVLAGRYGVSRDTARKARRAVLSEFDELKLKKLRQTTNSDQGQSLP